MNNYKVRVAPTEYATIKAAANAVDIHSNFNFLKAHNGLHRGMVHILLGTAGSGKSSLMRGLVLDCFKSNPDIRILYYLSEESTESFKRDLVMSGLENISDMPIYAISELECEPRDERQFFGVLKDAVLDIKPQLLIFDNITTSSLYNDRLPQEQFKFLALIKKFTEKFDLASMLVAHTSSMISDNMSRLINESDVRGSKSVVNLAEFFYILQRFSIAGHYYPVLKIFKHRPVVVDCKLYRLLFDREKRYYTSDLGIGFNDMRSAYDKRDKL